MQTVTSNYRVLIVDDNEGIHDDFRSLLESRGSSDSLDALAAELFGDIKLEEPAIDIPSYRFDSAFQGRVALESVKDALERGDSFALAFVDIRMPPGWDGIETIRKIWAIDPNIQMVICSAYSDYSWAEIVHELGVSDRLLLLRKPFDPSSVKQLALATTFKWSQEQAMRQQVRKLEAELDRAHRRIEALQTALARKD